MTRQLGGRYDLKEQIGGGGMAVVYRAVDSLLGRTVAVKMLRPQYLGDEEFTHRFRQEAQAVAKLSHPNIVNIYDVGITDGEYYIVMEYVDGPTLKDVIREHGTLSAEDTVYITRQICEALEHAHSHRIIHRDIKPANILITKAGMVKVTDFGIARAVSGNTMTYHRSNNSVMGSVHYFSPEQARGGTADVKSDIYSLGVVMYEMLTGRLPFSGDSAVSVALKHLRDPFVEPRSYVPEIPQSLENIVLRCLSKEPDHRFTDMRALQQDLDRALRQPDVAKYVAPAGVSDATISVPAISREMLREQERNLDAEREQEEAKKPRKWWKTLMWSGIGVAVLVIGAIAAYYIVMNLITEPNINVPNVVGKTEKHAIATLETAGFQANQIDEQKTASNRPAGTVVRQNPVPGQVKAGRTITLYVSKGAQKVTIPSLAGIPYDTAKSTLISYGFSAKNIIETQTSSTTYASGEVISTNPTAGTSVSANSQITVQVSSGAPQVPVPNVQGMTTDDASQTLSDSGLNPGTLIPVPTLTAPNGTVIKTSPPIGTSVNQGSSVNLYVAQNPSTPGQNFGGDTNNTTGNSSYGNTTNSNGQ